MKADMDRNQGSREPLDHKRVCTISNLSLLQTLLFEIECENRLPRSTEADSHFDNEHPSSGPREEKKASRWAGVKKLLWLIKIKNDAAKHASYDSSGSQGGKSKRQSPREPSLIIHRLRNVVGQMKTLLKDPKRFGEHSGKADYLNRLANELKATLKEMDSGSSDFIAKIEKISKELFELYSQILGDERNLYLPGLHKSENFKKSSAFEEVTEKFLRLDFVNRLCLLCFAVFPENREFKKTMLMYWWIGEGFLSAKDAEKRANEILEEFSKEGLIEPVKDDRKLRPNSYKMEAHVHSAVIYLAEWLGFFDIYNQKGKPFMAKSESDKVCLVEGSSLQPEAKVSKMKKLENVKTVFNSSERFPDFTFKWFRLMHSLKVLYLGRWERTPERHIEVEGTDFLEKLEYMKQLRLVSFQGISRIEKLHKSICKLPKLVILDLRSCYNLEVLPDEIDSLENLIYLDVSECYMLDRMPKEISVLSKLQVLKGFVVSDADEESCCTLSHLKHMQSLRKLSININKFKLEVENLMGSLAKLTQLESLKIAWGARFAKDNEKEGKLNKLTTKAGKTNENARQVKEKLEGLSAELKRKRIGEKDKYQGDNKGETSGEKKRVAEEKGKEKETDKGKSTTQMNADDKTEKFGLEESKERDGVDAKTQKSDKVIEEQKKVSPLKEPESIVQKKPDDLKGDSKEQKKEDWNKEVDQEESKEGGDVEAGTQKTNKIAEEDKKANPSQESEPAIQKKPDDFKGDSNEQKKENEKNKVDQEENKELGEVEEKAQKSDKILEEDKKARPSQESEPAIQKKPHDFKGDSKEQKKEDGDKEVDQEESKERGEVEEETQKSDKIVKEDKKASPSRESTPVMQKKPDNHEGESKEQKKEDGDKEVDQEESKERGGVEEEGQKSDKIVKEDNKASPSQESKPVMQKKPDNHEGDSKEQKKEDGEKEVDQEESKEHHRVEAEIQKSDKIVEENKKLSPSQESKATVQKEANDYKGENPMVENAAMKSSDSSIDKKRVSEIEEIHDPAPTSEIEKTTADGIEPSDALSSTCTFTILKRKGKREQNNAEKDSPKLPSRLKKLELECFPDEQPPSWLNPKDLKNLEKLSIRGGKLRRFSDVTLSPENECRVQVLRLNYLDEFKAEWKDLQALFPNMILLDKYRCPKVTFCPTDGNGVWRRSQPQASTQKPE